MLYPNLRSHTKKYKLQTQSSLKVPSELTNIENQRLKKIEYNLWQENKILKLLLKEIYNISHTLGESSNFSRASIIAGTLLFDSGWDSCIYT